MNEHHSHGRFDRLVDTAATHFYQAAFLERQNQLAACNSTICDARLSGKITYPGDGNYSAFTYDPLGRNVEIQEYSDSSLTSTKQFVWCGSSRCESRNADGDLTRQYFSRGYTNVSGDTVTPRFCTLSDPGSSVSEVTDSDGNIVAQYSFDPYGRVTQLQGSEDSDFQFAGYYVHAPSDLNLTLTRA